MRYRRANSFLADYRRLSAREQARFQDAVRKVIEACEGHSGRGVPCWPPSLRVKPVTNAPGIYEMTWSFSGPDGRATFDYVTEEGELVLRWRRTGGHEIFREP